MPRIIPHLWYDDNAREARDFYCRVFHQEQQNKPVNFDGTPSGKVELLEMSLFGQTFNLISAGPYFKFNPSISFLVNCNSEEEVGRYWTEFGKNAHIMMPLDSYPFSRAYGWLEDKYGLSWQFYYTEKATQKIIPTLMFVGENCGKAEEAVDLYTQVFGASGIGAISRYEKEEGDNKEGTIQHIDFKLEGTGFAAMDSGYKHNFTFNEAISFLVECRTQEEIDYYWEKLSAHPEAEQCGWLKDRYGVSWQIVPQVLGEMMKRGGAEKRAKITEAFLKMKKFDIGKLLSAYND